MEIEASSNKIKVYASYDTQNETWDVFDEQRNCLCYGSIWDIEAWLDEHKDTHEEIL